MKKAIKFLAKITGVEDDIRKDERRNFANKLDSAHYWFNSGDIRVPVCNALHYIYLSIIKYDHFRSEELRDHIDELGTTRYNKV